MPAPLPGVRGGCPAGCRSVRGTSRHRRPDGPRSCEGGDELVDDREGVDHPVDRACTRARTRCTSAFCRRRCSTTRWSAGPGRRPSGWRRRCRPCTSCARTAPSSACREVELGQEEQRQADPVEEAPHDAEAVVEDHRHHPVVPDRVPQQARPLGHQHVDAARGPASPLLESDQLLGDVEEEPDVRREQSSASPPPACPRRWRCPRSAARRASRRRRAPPACDTWCWRRRRRTGRRTTSATA